MSSLVLIALSDKDFQYYTGLSCALIPASDCAVVISWLGYFIAHYTIVAYVHVKNGPDYMIGDVIMYANAHRSKVDENLRSCKISDLISRSA